MNPKVTWVVVGIVAAVGLGYLASRVGNIGARSVRDGSTPLTLELSAPVLPGVGVQVMWATPLGEARGPVVLKARSSQEEIIVGRGEFGVGQAMMAIPCEMGGQTIGVALYEVGDDGEQLLSQRLAEVLPAGPDCVR